MATSARKHNVPAGGEKPERAAINRALASVNDIVPVANTTERAQLVSDLVAEGAGPTTARPLVVVRGDAPVGREIELTKDGTNWRALMSDSAEDWTAITAFGASMAANTFGLPPRVKRFSDGMTRCVGGVRRTAGSISAGEVLCTLPAGFAPPAFIEGVGATNQNGASVVRVEVQTDGTIRPLWGTLSGSITWVSLDQLHWPTT